VFSGPEFSERSKTRECSWSGVQFPHVLSSDQKRELGGGGGGRGPVLSIQSSCVLHSVDYLLDLAKRDVRGKMPKPLARAPENEPTDVIKYEKGQHWNMEKDGTKPIKYAETGPASEKECPEMTLIGLFREAVKKNGKNVALRTEGYTKPLAKGEEAPPALPLNQWKTWTWKDYQSDAEKVAKALIKLGAEQHDSCCILGFNAPEWVLTFMGCVHAGVKSAGIYGTDTADQIQFKSFHSDSRVAVIENQEAFEKFAKVIEDLPYLEAIVCWSYVPKENLKRSDGSEVQCMTFKDMLHLGAGVEDSVLEERIAKIDPSMCVGLIYTSGTTGRPKAVMISHDAIVFEASAVLPYAGAVGRKKEEERLISYLPLSHVAGLLVDVIVPVFISARRPSYVSCNFARPYDLKAGTLGARLGAVEPTLFLGVPRVWEKIMEKLLAVGAKTKGLKKKLSTAAKKRGLQKSLNNQLGGSGKEPSWGFLGIYKKLLGLIKGKLGLAKCKFALAGAAPMTLEALKYFGSLDININEAYGMSESCGATTWSYPQCCEWGSIGFQIPGTEVKVFNVAEDGSKTECPPCDDLFDAPEGTQGEICFRGRHIMIGYLANPKLGDDHVEEIREKNRGAIDEQGWLHSGDKGCVSKRGMFRITGRFKELIIGAGGENIAPVPIEDAWKAACHAISNVMMVGNKRKFNTMVVTLKTQGATGELPGTNKLDGVAAEFGDTIEEAVDAGRIVEELTEVMKIVNGNSSATPSNAAKIQKFTILPRDFSVATGELTATLKLKRSVAEDMWAEIIDAIYSSKDTFVPYTVVGSYDVDSRGDGNAGSFRGLKDLEMVDDETAAEADGMADDEEEEDE